MRKNNKGLDTVTLVTVSNPVSQVLWQVGRVSIRSLLPASNRGSS